MNECYQIKEPRELIDYLKEQGRNAYLDTDYQLQTNYGHVHILKNDQVIFFDNSFKQKGILFYTKECFDEIIKADKFPIDNVEKNMFDLEDDRIKTFHLQADYYREHLNSVLKFDFKEINKEAAQAYLKKAIGRFIKKLTTPKDVVALISVIGEIVKKETNGKWFLRKSYGTYNPFYEPNILTSNGNVVLISVYISGQIKWRVSSLDELFIEIHSNLIQKIEWENYSKDRNNLFMLE
jgi:hypothetical protein